MKPGDLILRCYAEEERDGTWFAMCLDLNLYARGDSVHEVKRKLHDFIKGYIREVLTEDEKYIYDLIPRRAPLYFWFRYYCISLICRFNDAKRKHAPRKFNEHLPLKPA